MDLNDFDLPFATDNAIELSGGSRSKGYRVGDYIVRIPLRHICLMAPAVFCPPDVPYRTAASCNL